MSWTDAFGATLPGASSLANIGTGTEFGDTLSGEGGADTIYGLGGNDRLAGDSATVINFLNGGDLIFGGDGNDTIFGGGFGDTLDGGAGNDSIVGGIGNPMLALADIADLIRGGDGDDTLSGEGGADTIEGGAGADSLSGGDLNDLMSGGDGADVADGGAGADTISGGAGDDSLLGGTGNGADRLLGGDGADTLAGGAGADTLVGGQGDDSLAGGGDSDLYAFRFAVTQGAAAPAASFTDSAFWSADRVVEGEIADGTAQSLFSRQYTAWLNDLVARHEQDIIARFDLGVETLDADGDGVVAVDIRQGTRDATPWIEGLTDAQLGEIFGDRESFLAQTGRTRHERHYSDSFSLGGTQSASVAGEGGNDRVEWTGTDRLALHGLEGLGAAEFAALFDVTATAVGTTLAWEGGSIAIEGLVLATGGLSAEEAFHALAVSSGWLLGEAPDGLF